MSSGMAEKPSVSEIAYAGTKANGKCGWAKHVTV